MRFCSRCQKEKPLSAFGVNRAYLDGIHRYCKACSVIAAVAWGKKNQDKIRVREKLRRTRHPDRAKRWREQNPDKKRAAEKEYRRNHPDVKRAIDSKYRAAKLSTDGHYDAKDVARIREAQHNHCAYCRCKLDRRRCSVDHIIPLSKGGSNWPANIQLTCKKCNSAKRALHPIAFARRRGLLL
jgi:5-methylcytosine-specific restriction endonuclease McrA